MVALPLPCLALPLPRVYLFSQIQICLSTTLREPTHTTPPTYHPPPRYTPVASRAPTSAPGNNPTCTALVEQKKIKETMATPEQPTVAPPADIGAVNVVETPTSPSSAFTLSRFEFETGTKGNEGTKILMVEWDARAATEAAAASSGDADREREQAQNGSDDWEVTWEGKKKGPGSAERGGEEGEEGKKGGRRDRGDNIVLPIRDTDAPEGTRRVYFLLPPGAPIPTLVTISKRSGLTELRTKPLPAIFPEGLVSEDKGTRGVLHTIWAKRRLRELETEIEAEMRDNGESVGLEMALQERQWIVDHFGLQIDTSSAEAIPLAPHNPDSSSPVSPRSPIGGRLGERLKGLKLATSPAELAAAKEGKSLVPVPYM